MNAFVSTSASALLISEKTSHPADADRSPERYPNRTGARAGGRPRRRPTFNIRRVRMRAWGSATIPSAASSGSGLPSAGESHAGVRRSRG